MVKVLFIKSIILAHVVQKILVPYSEILCGYELFLLMILLLIGKLSVPVIMFIFGKNT